LLELRFLLVRHEHNGEAGGTCFRLSRADSISEEDVIDVWKQDAKNLCSADSQAARERIRFVSQLRNRDLNSSCNVRTDGLAPTHMAGYRRRAHLRSARHINDSRALDLFHDER
jgi:hypothetical protein